MNYLKERNIVTVLLLMIFTCGFYSLYIYFQFNSEVRNQAIKEGVQAIPTSPIIAFLLTMVTCGIYGIYYMYVVANSIFQMGKRNNYDTMEPTLVLLLSILGVGMLLNIYYASELSKRISANQAY